jgi:hypothetical protein
MEEYWYRFVHGPYQDVVISRDGRVLDTDAHGTCQSCMLRMERATATWIIRRCSPQERRWMTVRSKMSLERVRSDDYDRTIRHINGNLQDNRIENLHRHHDPFHPADCWVKDYLQASCTDTRTSAIWWWTRRYCGESRCTVLRRSDSVELSTR